MFQSEIRRENKIRRHNRIRKTLKGNSERPRLIVHRSSHNISVQVIDDLKGITLAAASSFDKQFKGKLKHGGNVEAAKAVGAEIAKLAKAKSITRVVFDRGGYIFHGRIKALADTARENGLQF